MHYASKIKPSNTQPNQLNQTNQKYQSVIYIYIYIYIYKNRKLNNLLLLIEIHLLVFT